MATPILAEKGIELHTFFNVEAIDPARKVVRDLRSEDFWPKKRSSWCRRIAGAKIVIDSRAGAGKRKAAGRSSHLHVGGRSNVYALRTPPDLPLSKAGSTAHFEAPIVAERITAAVQGREPKGKHASYTGKVMCFFEVGDGKGTLLQFDYNNPPKPPKPNRFWHLGKIVFNKTYWHTVPRGPSPRQE